MEYSYFAVLLRINKRWSDKTWIDKTWIDITWIDITWSDKTWSDITRIYNEIRKGFFPRFHRILK